MKSGTFLMGRMALKSNFTIIHNSWDERYRKPFGAVKKGTSIRFFLETDGVKKVWLEIHRDFGAHGSIEMEKVTGGFEVEFTMAETVLHYYHFRVLTEDNGEVLYGNNQKEYGGLGEILTPSCPLFDYQITVYDYDDFAPKWYLEGVAYHIFVDRFFTGQEGITSPKENTFIYGTKSDRPVYIKDENGDILRWDFFGGDLWGIIEKLPYLQELGVTILYLSPIFAARSNHRYDTANYMEIEPMIGGEEAFVALIKEAEKLGMKLILDGVFNHCGADSVYFDRYKRFGDGAYDNEESVYRRWFHFKDSDEYDSWWGIADLPRFNGANKDLRNFLLQVVEKWSSYGIGGWRLDVADELSDEFIAQIRSKLSSQQVLLGEVWEDPTNKIAYGVRRYYTKGNHLHGAMNYPFRDSILSYVRKEISTEETVRKFNHYLENFPPHVLYNNFNNLGTHDTVRLMTELGEDEKYVKLSVLLLLMLPGVPCIYYGDEVGLSGGKDPDNRRFYPWEKVENGMAFRKVKDKAVLELTDDLQQFYLKVIQFRNTYKALTFGDVVIKAFGDVLVILREYEEQQVYACFNLSDRVERIEDKEHEVSFVLEPKSYCLKIKE